jgi:hypothetical protein
MDTTHFAPLITVRAAAYAAFGRRRDALFELCDTLLTTGPVASLPLLSVQLQHRRGWGSLYDALSAGGICTPHLGSLLTEHPLAGGEPLYAVDISVWPRCDAETSPGRARVRPIPILHDKARSWYANQWPCHSDDATKASSKGTCPFDS